MGDITITITADEDDLRGFAFHKYAVERVADAIAAALPKPRLRPKRGDLVRRKHDGYAQVLYPVGPSDLNPDEWEMVTSDDVEGLFDSKRSVEDLVGLPDEGAPGETTDGQVLDDGIEDAEIVPAPDDGAETWAQRWTELCRAARCDRETSRWLLSETCGTRVDRAADVPADRRAACEAALAQWVANMAAPADGEA